MTYKGHVQNGVVVLDDPVNLADGARVRIEVVQEAQSEALHPEILRFTGVLPPDIDARAEYADGVAKKHA
ncbi:MAG: hypothetical protein GY851_24195 [bacterium]|nr:hypothetical protein [bacterium]